MRPVSVRFACFGPYMEEQYVDFEALRKNGLFLICGETGAGKTTILDAICYALYGRSSGGLRGDLSVMRCKLAGQSDETLTEFVFDNNGKRYKFIRSLKYGRKNLNDSHNCMVLEGDSYVPLFENPKATFVNKKAEELIGLSYDQFRQVILLPQGQFEKLLVSDSAEKEKILVSLFHADRWQKIAEELARRVAEQDAALKQEKLEISGKLREYGCDNVTVLEEKLRQQTLAVEELHAAMESAVQKVAVIRRQKEQALLEDSAFAELARRERQLMMLEQQILRFDGEEQLLQKADKAEQIRPHHLQMQEARRELLRREKQFADAQRMLQTAQREKESAEKAWKLHAAGQADYDANRQLLQRLEESRELYQELDGKRERVQNTARILLEEKRRLAEADAAFARRDQIWQQAVLAQNQAIGEYQRLQDAYLRGIGGILAEKLMAGVACPVCGSLEHPAPARNHGDHISDARLDAGKKNMTKAAELESDARSLRTQAERKKLEAAEHCQLALQAETAARLEYEAMLTRLLPGVESEAQRSRKSAAVKKLVLDYEQEELRQKQAVADAMGSFSAARTRQQECEESLKEAGIQYSEEEAAWKTVLESSGFASEQEYQAADLPAQERQRRNMALIQFRTDLRKARQEAQEQRLLLEGRTAPDMKAISAQLDAADSSAKGLSAQYTLAENLKKTMERDRKNLARRMEDYLLRRSKVDGDLDFANRLRGRNGVGLQRYVLGVMLTSVTSAANELLRNVCSGRYRLYRTDEIAGSGRKGGLELEVYDSHTNARRSVTTLSGGEKFLVALSLAIGLSTVVQAQGGGIRLEAMFIDEGFGSLDRDAVNDALDVLEGIRRSSGVVGIISHVEQLTEVIPTRLEVKRGRKGSFCQICE